MHPLRLPSSVTGLIPPWRPGIKLRGPDLGQGARLSGRETFHVGGAKHAGASLPTLTDCARNPTERTRSHLEGPTVRLNRWWWFPSALGSAVAHVYGDTNGDGKGADLALGCGVSELKEDINNAFHQLV